MLLFLAFLSQGKPCEIRSTSLRSAQYDSAGLCSISCEIVTFRRPLSSSNEVALRDTFDFAHYDEAGLRSEGSRTASALGFAKRQARGNAALNAKMLVGRSLRRKKPGNLCCHKKSFEKYGKIFKKALKLCAKSAKLY